MNPSLATGAEGTLVLHSRPLGFYERDPESDRTVWAGDLTEALGIDPVLAPETLDEWIQLVHPDDRSRVERQLTTFVAEREPVHLSYRVRSQSGEYVSICEDAVFLSPRRVLGVVSPSDNVSITHDLFSQFVDVTPLGVVLVDESRRILYANESLGTVFGFRPAELRGTLLEDIIPGIWQHTRAGSGDAAADSIAPLRLEFDGRHRDGSEVPIAVGLNALQLGGTSSFVCTILDLSDLKRRERNAERFFELSVDLLCIADKNGYFKRVNPSFTRVLGYSEAELLQTPFLEFVHRDDQAETLAAVERLASGIRIEQFRNRYRKQEGGYRWLEWTAQPAKESGTIYAIARDVTARMAMEAQLRAHQERERAILDNTVAVIYVKDLDGRYEFVNRQFLELFGKTMDDVIGHTDYDIFSPEIACQFWANDRRVLETGETLSFQETAPHQDGLHTYISVKVPLRDAGSRVVGMAGISTDITERVRADATVQELQSAQTVQKKLYPDTAPNVPGLDVAGSARPVAQLCGDYYDYLVRPNGRLAVTVGDVSGHGMGPALGMVQTRTLLRMLLNNHVPLDEVLARINRLLCCDLPEGTFVSLFIAEIDAETGRVTYAGAGHDAWIVRSDGDVTHLTSTGMVLGLMENESFEYDNSLYLAEGDALLLVTDGVFEAMAPNRDAFGKERVEAVASQNLRKGSQDILDVLFDAVDSFTEGYARDDMTAVLVKR